MSNTYRILIVDDDVLDRQAARRTLLSTGLIVEVVEAERAEEAIERLSAKWFDAVLLDYQLPDADGLEVLHEMAVRGISTPVLMLTGNGDDMMAAELMKAGAADYLSKSKLTPQALERSLSNAIRLHQAEVEAARAEAERVRLLENLAVEQGQLEAILTSMTDGLVISDLSGNVLAMNPAALKMYGYSNIEESRHPLSGFADIFDLKADDGSALPRDHWPLARVLRGEVFSHLAVNLSRRDTGKSWTGSYSGSLVRSKTGEIILALLTIRDITEIRQAQLRAAFLAEASVRLSASLDAKTTLETITSLTVPTLADWCTISVWEGNTTVLPLIVAHADPANQATAEELLKPFSVDTQADFGVGYVMRTGEAQFLPEVTEDIRRTVAGDDGQRVRLLTLGIGSYLCIPLQVRGRVLGALSLASMQSHRYDQEDLALALELGRRVAAALDNVRLFEEVRARAEREAMINKIGSALRVTLDTEEVLEIVTEQVGEALGASRCRFARLSATRDTLEAAARHYAAPGVPRMTQNSRLTEWPGATVDNWVAGHPVAMTGNGRASLACPVFLRGQFGGVFLLEQTDRARVWTPDEISFLSAITDILALALENARLYAREHRVADMLSSAFLTDIPDELPGLALAANYRAGLVDEARVGGDYYDAFVLPDGRVALVIADVSGKGLSAAVQTATVKYSLRAFATEASAPSLVLTRLNRMLCSDLAGLGDHFVTLFYAVFDPATGCLAWGSAGHESVLIKRAIGGADVLDSTGPILGLAEHTYTQAEDFLSPGDSLVLYTDGLTEARDTETRVMLEVDGVRRLVEAVPAAAFPGVLASYLQQSALDWTQERPQDDIALLVARCLPPPLILRADSADAASADTASDTFHFRPSPVHESEENREKDDSLFDFHFPSRASYAADVRQAIGHWMPTLGFDRAATEDFQTAVTEAVTNAVRHGSPGGAASEFRVLGRCTSEGALSVEVTDSGLGLLPPLTRMPSPEALGGRGLPLMQELSDAVEFRPDPSGLCVALLKRRSFSPQ